MLFFDIIKTWHHNTVVPKETTIKERYFLIADGEDYFAISAAFSHLLRLTSNGYVGRNRFTRV